MIRKAATAASIALVAIAGQAYAAEGARLSSIKGSVLVNQNGRYVPVSATTNLRAGDRVMATDGQARVTYADGCNVTISARSMATIASTSPCGGSSGKVVKVAQQGYGSGDDDGDGGNADLWAYLGYGVLTVVVVGSALNNQSKPSSP